jgi:hypothetical protein
MTKQGSIDNNNNSISTVHASHYVARKKYIYITFIVGKINILIIRKDHNMLWLRKAIIFSDTCALPQKKH